MTKAKAAQRPQRATAVTRSGRVAILGRPNVGKSTLMNAALQQPLAIVSATPQTTRDAILGIVRHSGSEIAFLDTPGLHRPKTELGRVMNRTAREVARSADVIVLVVSPPTGNALERLRVAVGEPDATPGTRRGARPAKRTRAPSGGAAGPARPAESTLVHPGDASLVADLPEGVPAVLVVNKVDQVRDKRLLLPLLEALAKLHDFAAVVPVSALKQSGIERLLDAIAPLCPEGSARWGEDDMTDRPLRFFASEYVREQILRATAEEVPHAAAVEILKFEEPPGGGALRIDATIHVERPGQKKILVGARAEMLKRIGTAARLRLEELCGRRVHLALWVRVTPDWRDSTRQLAELGYESGGSA